VATKATPLLAPLIEEGFAGTEVSRGAIDTYLSEKAFRRIQALILGCTHYPLLKEEIEAYYQGRVRVVDSAHGVALALQALLRQEDLLRAASLPETHFYVSENTPAFTQVARRFFGSEISLEERLLPA
jgi:glutamate racemase